MAKSPKVSEPEYRLRESYSESLLEMKVLCDLEELNFMAELQIMVERWTAKHKRNSKEKSK